MAADQTIPVQGHCDAPYQAVAEAFRANFYTDVEVGASFCAYVGGRKVVDFWGGHIDRAQQLPWQQDTLVNLYSTTKGLACLAFATLLDDQLVSLDQPVVDIWPQLQAAQTGLTVAQLLSHQGGLCGLAEPVTVTDLYHWEHMVALLEKQPPLWELGSGVGYHALLWGFLIGEITQRVSGKSLGQLLRERLAEPLSASVHLGLPVQLQPQVAALIGPNHARSTPDPQSSADPAVAPEPPPLSQIVMSNPVVRPYQDASSTAWQQAEIAAANGQGNARGIATLYAVAASGGRFGSRQFISRDTLTALCKQQVSEAQIDLVLGYGLRRGSGFILNTRGQFGPNAEAFGHTGAGGSVGFADPTAEVAVGYAMNQMQPGMVEATRAAKLIKALYSCL